MLNTHEVLPRADQLMQALIVLHLLAPLAYMTALGPLARVTVHVFLATALVVVGVTLWCVWRRQRARAHGSAFVLVIAGSVITLMRTVGVVPTNMFTINALQFGSAMDMLLLAFALVDRVNVLCREKLMAERQLLEATNSFIRCKPPSARSLCGLTSAPSNCRRSMRS